MADAGDSGDAQTQLAPGELRAEISKAIVQLYSECYGKGPTKCRTHAMGDLVVTVLEDIFTTAERTLVNNGEEDAVRGLRLTFQGATEARFREVIEELTGRRVRSFVSAVDIDRETAYEIFQLEMAGELADG